MKQTDLATLFTPEAARVDEPALYPRPALVRDSFFSLNGTWEFCATPASKAPAYTESIRVPFAPESALSGIAKRYPKDTVLHYRRRFALPDGFLRDRVILHVGAADQIARVTLNGKEIGEHRGGYLPFSFDITDALVAGENTLEITVTDELYNHVLPWGKQREDRGGMWYTPISGIWQDVWLESVPKDYIRALEITADDRGATIRAEGVDEGMLIVRLDNGFICEKMRDGTVRIQMDAPQLWSPESPHLYHFTLTAGEDKVSSYFACRTVTTGVVDGVPRILLNGKPYFFHGLLDQGYFPDGIYTPAHPAAYERDILLAKSLGFNTLRKHIKIEPQRFYYDCDRLGMIVFQDMVNNGEYSFLRDTALPTVGIKSLSDKHLHRDKATRAAFLDAMKETVALLKNHPSICYWTIFNEGWGQFEGDAAYDILHAIDSTRIIDTASGWFRTKKSDVESPHVYFKPVKLKPAEKPILLSEFGGYSLAVADHVFNTKKVYGYKKFEDVTAFCKALTALYENEIIPQIGKGLCGAIYTQLTDVEDEINGLATYDRKSLKVEAAEMLAIAEKLKI